MPSIAEQEALGWGNPGGPGSSMEQRWKDANLATLSAAGISVPVNRVLVPIFRELIVGLDHLGANLDQRRDDWGFANRDIRGYPGIKSYHAWGLAVDLDATENPMGVRRTTFPITRTRALASRLGLTWGYDFDGRPDAMHFEFRGSRAAAKQIADRLTIPLWPLDDGHSFGHKRSNLLLGRRVHDGSGSAADKRAVQRIEKFLGLDQDGWFSWADSREVARWQRAHGIDDTGRVGQATARGMRLWR